MMVVRKRLRVFALVFTPFILLTSILGIGYLAPKIQQDLQIRSLAALNQVGVKIDFLVMDGRDAKILGEVKDEKTREMAEIAVRGTYGVREVENRLNITVDRTPQAVVNVKSSAADFNFFEQTPVFFDLNHAKPRPESLKHLSAMAKFMKAQPPGFKIEIEGHTDAKGSASYNLELGQKRANAIYDILVRLGVSPSSLSTVSKGKESPVAENITPEGRQDNRRVTFKVKAGN